MFRNRQILGLPVRLRPDISTLEMDTKDWVAASTNWWLPDHDRPPVASVHYQGLAIKRS